MLILYDVMFPVGVDCLFRFNFSHPSLSQTVLRNSRSLAVWRRQKACVGAQVGNTAGWKVVHSSADVIFLVEFVRYLCCWIAPGSKCPVETRHTGEVKGMKAPAQRTENRISETDANRLRLCKSLKNFSSTPLHSHFGCDYNWWLQALPYINWRLRQPGKNHTQNKWGYNTPYTVVSHFNPLQEISFVL